MEFFGPPQAEFFGGLEGLIRIPPLIRYKILIRGVCYAVPPEEEFFSDFCCQNGWKAIKNKQKKLSKSIKNTVSDCVSGI